MAQQVDISAVLDDLKGQLGDLMVQLSVANIGLRQSEERIQELEAENQQLRDRVPHT